MVLRIPAIPMGNQVRVGSCLVAKMDRKIFIGRGKLEGKLLDKNLNTTDFKIRVQIFGRNSPLFQLLLKKAFDLEKVWLIEKFHA